MTVERPVVEASESVPTHGVELADPTLSELGVRPGDVVSVTGQERTAGVAVATDDEQGVGLSAQLRENAGVTPGDTVELIAASAPAAATVSLRLTQPFAVTRAEATLRNRLVGRPVTTGDRVEASLLGGGLTLELTVVDVDPSSPAVVEEETDITVLGDDEDDEVDVVSSPSVSYDDLAGIDAAVREFGQLASVRFDRAGEFAALDRPAGAGVLLSGPPGSGKSTLVEAVAAETGATFVPVSVGSLLGAGGGDAADRLDRVCDVAAGADRTLVLFDDFDVLDDEAGPHLVARLGAAVDDLRSNRGTVVVGATTDPGGVPESLRRGGRLDREIELDSPDRADRRDVLASLLGDVSRVDSVDLDAVAAQTHGFVAADLASLVDRVVEQAIARDGATIVRQSDFERALGVVDPSGLRDLAVEFPAVSWEDVGGLAAAKRQVVRAVHWPLEHPELFDDAGVDPPRGVLLYGPPGTGKTMLARAVAGISDANYVSVNGPELLDRYVGESERAVRDLFRTARQNAPTVIFFDEVDAISPERRDGDSGASERVVSQLLTELDGLEPLEDVAVVAATNRPEMIDPALLRPGRLEKTVETPLPDVGARREIVAVHTRDMPLTEEVDLDDLARRTDGFSGGDIAALAREAAMLAIERTVTDDREVVVGAEQFDEALERISPSVTEERSDEYATFDG
jgi:transitional endoplasmic reticulum ATPase